MWIYIITDEYAQMEREANTLSFFQSVLDVDRRLMSVACAWDISRDLPDAAVLHSSTLAPRPLPPTPHPPHFTLFLKRNLTVIQNARTLYLPQHALNTHTGSCVAMTGASRWWP